MVDTTTTTTTTTGLSVMVDSFSLPYLSAAPTLATFKRAGAAADSDSSPGGSSTDVSSPGGSSADAMTHVMSQVIAQLAAGQVVSYLTMSCTDVITCCHFCTFALCANMTMS